MVDDACSVCAARAALAAVEAGQAALEEDGAFLDQAAGQLKSNIVGYPESDDDETSNAREGDPLMELQRQLSFLRNEFSAEVSERVKNRRRVASCSGLSVFCSIHENKVWKGVWSIKTTDSLTCLRFGICGMASQLWPFFSFPSFLSGVHHLGWDFCICDCFFNPTIEVVTFCLLGCWDPEYPEHSHVFQVSLSTLCLLGLEHSLSSAWICVHQSTGFARQEREVG